MKILAEKTLLICPIQNILKWLIEIKKCNNFHFHTSLWYLKRFHFLGERSVRIKIYVIPPPPPPPPPPPLFFWGKKGEKKKLISSPPPPPSPIFLFWQRGLRLHFVELLTYTISISLTIEIHKNSIDTFIVTNKKYYQIILSWNFLSNFYFYQFFL